MAEAILVEPKIKAGAELLHILDTALGDVFAAFWYRDPDTEDWRLLIGSDVVDREGPTVANGHLVAILNSREIGLSLFELALVGRNHPLVLMLKSLPKTGRKTLSTPMHVYRAMVGNHYIEDAYIYRIT
jgi:hypothetical protein